ncbi:hypothetical protein [Methyloligella solikamskensis]|uniref:Uncharacterized protein n=1 Tax=Methyloligella solikamskensis TaxID=1177756 RepID=A0ABW3J5C3_9HYPH
MPRLSPHPATERERAILMHNLKQKLPKDMKPEIGKALFALVPGGGSYSCGMVHAIEPSGRQTQWSIFEFTVVADGNSRMNISKPGQEEALMARCRSRGLGLED